MTAPNFPLIARQLRQAADLLDTQGAVAWKRALACHSPLRSTFDANHAAGTHSDPTAAAALNPDPLVEAFPRLRQAVEVGYANVMDAAALVAVLAKNMAENERAGVGHCEKCQRYCDGSRSDRLRAGLCQACDAKNRRAKASA